MNKILLFSVISIFILASLVIAQDNSSSEISNESGSGSNKSLDLEKIKDLTKDLGKNTRDKVTTFSNKEVILPDWLKKISNVLFGLKEDLSIEKLIVMIILLIVFISTFLEILEFTAFENKITKRIIAISITLIFSISGSLISIAEGLLKTGPLILNWKMLVFIVILVILFKIVKKIMHHSEKLKKSEKMKGKMDEARETVQNLANFEEKLTKP